MENVPENQAEAERKKKKKANRKYMRFERHRTAIERLQVAWMKYSITLSVFGFTIDRILESKMEQGREAVFGFIGGREIGLFLLLIGIGGLSVATIQHARNVKRFNKIYEQMPASISLRLSFVILGFCTLMFLAVLFKLYRSLLSIKDLMTLPNIEKLLLISYSDRQPLLNKKDNGSIIVYKKGRNSKAVKSRGFLAKVVEPQGIVVLN